MCGQARRMRVGWIAARALLVVALLAAAPLWPAAAQVEPEVESRLRSLVNIVRTEEQLVADRRRLQTELVSEAGRGREDQLRASIRQISDAITQLEQAFATIAAEVDPIVLEDEPEVEELQLTDEVKELLAPLVSELKRATARPREIDRLRTEIGELSGRVDTVQRAIDNLDALLAAAVADAVRDHLEAERQEWRARLQTEQTHLGVARQKLDHHLSKRRTLGQTLDDIFELFFKSRGRNLVVAILASVLFWVLLRRAHGLLRRRVPKLVGSGSLWSRVFDLVYMVFTAIAALSLFIIILYSFGDWVLLVVVVLIIAGLAWASKQAIPRFWSQATLLLDMGPVRDGERLRIDGVPYRVESLGLYTLLDNPLLAGGPVRLPIDDLVELRSRPWSEREPWFPTREGDYVRLQDGTFGQVELQTVEVVRLRRAGGATRAYPTADFLTLSPDVLSDGYLILVQFGIDYRHQPGVTSEIPARLRDFIARGIDARGRSEWTVSLGVEFAEAGASSLDLVVLWEVTGDAAPSYFGAHRLIQRLCVDACNEYGWEIPFQQVTIHTAGTRGAEAARVGEVEASDGAAQE